MDIVGIIGAMSAETELILNSMDVTDVRQYAGFEFFEGKCKGISIVLTSCSMGKVNAASFTQILIDRFAVKKIIK